ncbi:MAG: hypothetical protein C4324_08245 [Blastocatellia bacterium]
MSSFAFMRFADLRHLVFAFWIASFFSADATGQSFKPVADGVEFAELRHAIGDEPINIFLLRLDPNKIRLDVVHAMDSAIGLENTSSIARRYGAIAAINGGFFRLDNSIWAGDASGVLMIDCRLLSESTNNRIALLINNTRGNKTNIEFAPVKTDRYFQIGNRRFNFTGINRQRKEEDLIEYTPEFATTSLTEAGGLEITVVKTSIVAVNNRRGSNPIPSGGFVISATGKFADELKPLAIIGKRVTRFTRVRRKMILQSRNPLSSRTLRAFASAEDITNGVSELVRDGKVHLTWETEKASTSFALNRHPRTAIAKLDDGKILLVAVDGRRPNISVGMTLQELAEYLLSIGATDAMNLDGGGSTTMYLDGRVVNAPSDAGGERRIADALIVTLRKKSTSARKKITSR